MVGRFGRGGLIKKAFGGIMEGLADGGIGGGNILSHVAQSIVGGDGGNTSRAIPGALNFSDDSNVVTPGNYFANALDDDNPRPSKRPNTGTTPGFAEGFGGGGAPGNMPADYVPTPTYNDNFSTIPPGQFMGPVMPQGMSTGGGHSGCSCSSKKYSCEEKCAYDAQMKEKCKGCKTYYRRKKQYIYPKRKRYSKKRSYTPRRRYTRRRY